MKKAFWGPVKYQLQLLTIHLLGPQETHLVVADPCGNFGRRQGSTCMPFLPSHFEFRLRCFVCPCSPFGFSDFPISRLGCAIVLPTVFYLLTAHRERSCEATWQVKAPLGIILSLSLKN